LLLNFPKPEPQTEGVAWDEPEKRYRFSEFGGFTPRP
jgi:hypothetical protein